MLGTVARGERDPRPQHGAALSGRTFCWFGRNRRLAKDFENLAETVATFVTLASIELALRRLDDQEMIGPADGVLCGANAFGRRALIEILGAPQ
jgi:hypothetical protein